MSLGGCTTLVDRAIEAELVERGRDQNDRRVVWAQISAHGEQVLNEIRQARSAILVQYLAGAESSEIDRLAALLDKVVDAVLAHELQDLSIEAA